MHLSLRQLCKFIGSLVRQNAYFMSGSSKSSVIQKAFSRDCIVVCRKKKRFSWQTEPSYKILFENADRDDGLWFLQWGLHKKRTCDSCDVTYSNKETVISGHPEELPVFASFRNPRHRCCSPHVDHGSFANTHKNTEMWHLAKNSCIGPSYKWACEHVCVSVCLKVGDGTLIHKRGASEISERSD